ncbi:M24 family metallopeptidase [Pseudactinotalea sp. Z1739]|uniref:M24 family metallopeptidase n=1 Tax=Pseudactinotalea sp. Z1739 TaxID=3413028 RepID=UPI003C7D8DC6
MTDLEVPGYTLPDTPEPYDARPFAVSEYINRLERVQHAMSSRGLNALMVADPANLYYLTGYNAWSFYTPQCLVVPAEGSPHLFARAMDAQGAHWTAYLERTHIHGYPEHYVQRADIHPMDWITEQARNLGLFEDVPGAVIAVEMDAHYFSPRGFFALHSRLVHAAIVDSVELVNWVRAVKSPAEQEKMRVAGQIASTVMQVAMDAIEVGRRQCDVVAEIQHAQALGSHHLGGDYPAIVPMLPTGQSAGTPHLTWSDAPLVRGEPTTIEIAGVHRRYHAPLARTVALGRPHAELARCADAVTEGLHAALEVMGPGATGREVHAAFADSIARRGFYKESRIGYSIGVGYPPDWGERTISLRAEEQTVLAPGMCFHIIMGMWMEGWGYEMSESVMVTADGAEQLTDFPQGLTVKT